MKRILFLLALALVLAACGSTNDIVAGGGGIDPEIAVDPDLEGASDIVADPGNDQPPVDSDPDPVDAASASGDFVITLSLIHI